MTHDDSTTPERTRRCSRRDVLALAGSVVTVGLAGCLTSSPTATHGWQRVDSPTGKALRDVVLAADGPVAAGESGRVLARTDDDWEIVVESGPGGASNGLTGAAVTNDSERVWMCGDSGAAGFYDVADDELTDRSAPKEKTSSWEDVAVVGQAGGERISLINGSGELLVGRNQQGTIQWGEVTKPTDGDSVNAIATRGAAGYLCDTTGNVSRKRSDGGWRSIGIDDVSTSLHDVATLDPDTVTVVADDGSIFLYNGFNWISVASVENALHAVDRRDGRGTAVGPGGTVVTVDGNEWSVADTSVSKTLHGVALGTVEYSDVAVGADGTILENFQ
ncbi:hypothetical protein [Halococcus saccharolyticus]|uniref:Uncharacterized protein n=1 Tax=Halococcus saccharolyticus DSM 5350 TaxID=1227455 RepID=M0MQE8_9EURY|nr:hypothetical protein [Halococcus saccharolyticus]EMA47861.1 hypothetical protein C449_00275 [Halococcus saccharolyticus DSM 5350]